LRYTVEARPLTQQDETRSTTIEASDAGEALNSFARENRSEIVSFQSMQGRESIATVRRNDSVYLVRVYSN